MTVKYFLIAVFFIFLCLKIVFSLKKNIRMKYVFTPLTTITLVFLALYSLYSNVSLYGILLIVGLIFAFAGDILNMIEPPDYAYADIGGLFFVFTQFFYTAAFFRKFHFGLIDVFLSLFFIIAITVFIAVFIRKAANFILKTGLAVYITAATVSLYAASSGLFFYCDAVSALNTAGMLFFWLSDIVLGYHLLIRKLKYESLFVWGLYAPGQFLIILSIFFRT